MGERNELAMAASISHLATCGSPNCSLNRQTREETEPPSTLQTITIKQQHQPTGQNTPEDDVMELDRQSKYVSVSRDVFILNVTASCVN